MAELLIGPQTVTKNSRETLRISVDEYKNKKLLSARLWYVDRDDATGELKPGRDGFAIALDKLPQVVAAFQRLAEAAYSAGLLDRPSIEEAP